MEFESFAVDFGRDIAIEAGEEVDDRQDGGDGGEREAGAMEEAIGEDSGYDEADEEAKSEAKPRKKGKKGGKGRRAET